MTALHVDHVSFAHSSSLPLFDDVSVHLGPGWTGVVGANGAGKTTFLRLVAGDLRPDRGFVTTDPSDAVVVVVPQGVDTTGPAVERLGATHDALARRWLGALSLDPQALTRWPTLSPGERKRWQLAAALAAAPDLLLLDEPTNHLDAEARVVVLDALRSFSGVGLIVSHDRTLLDELTVRTLRVERRGVRLWSAAYSSARDAWQAEDDETHRAYQGARRQERATRRRLADERRKSDARSAARRRDVRRGGVADRDARSVAAKARHDAGASSAAQRMSRLRSELDRKRDELSSFDVERELGGPIFVDYQPSPKRVLMHHSGPLRAGDRVLLADVDVAVGRSDRIRLTGPNGAGKSTLLAQLYEGAAGVREHLLHLPQELTADDGVATLERLHSFPAADRGRVLSIVALLGVDPDYLLASDRPSPGEMRKLTLALALGTNAWGLVLDEPTNHFDLPAIERLEAALETYPGALVVVTHDERFASATTTLTWHLEDGELVT